MSHPARSTPFFAGRTGLTPSFPLLALLLSAAAISATASPGVHAAPPTAQAPSAATVHADSFALVRGDVQQLSVSGDTDSDSWPALKQLRRNIDGEFLWFREEGKSWIVQDPEVLARARAAYAPLERLGKQMDAHGKEMNSHGKAMNALGKDMSREAAGLRPDRTRMSELQRQMHGLGRQMGELGRQMGQAQDPDERQRLQAQMTRLSAQMSALGHQMGEAGDAAGQRAARRNMDEIGRRMDDAGKPMDALGKQMDALGKQMQREGEAANKTVRALIRDAMARGLARPAPLG